MTTTILLALIIGAVVICGGFAVLDVYKKLSVVSKVFMTGTGMVGALATFGILYELLGKDFVIGAVVAATIVSIIAFFGFMFFAGS
jgi:hypothetical protein